MKCTFQFSWINPQGLDEAHNVSFAGEDREDILMAVEHYAAALDSSSPVNISEFIVEDERTGTGYWSRRR